VEEEENTSEHYEDAEAAMEVRITVREELAAAAEVDTKALDIIQHMRDMVKAHVREAGKWERCLTRMTKRRNLLATALLRYCTGQA
jgi:hypothetical protein